MRQSINRSQIWLLSSSIYISSHPSLVFHSPPILKPWNLALFPPRTVKSQSLFNFSFVIWSFLSQPIFKRALFYSILFPERWKLYFIWSALETDGSDLITSKDSKQREKYKGKVSIQSLKKWVCPQNHFFNAYSFTFVKSPLLLFLDDFAWTFIIQLGCFVFYAKIESLWVYLFLVPCYWVLPFTEI